MDPTATLLVARRRGVVTLTLNRPHRKNALTSRMIDDLCAALADVERRTEDRVLVLTGAGGEFCSGADLSDPESPALAHAGTALTRVRRVGDMALMLQRLRMPTIAKVDGVAVGAGLGLALGCDLVVASERARLSMIFVRRALSPDNGTSWLLPRLVGMARAKEVAFLGDMLDAPTAKELGLVGRVVPADALDATVEELAERLADGPALALSLTKKLLGDAWTSSLEDALEHEAQAQALNLAGPDTAEAIRAFLDKREPCFRRD
jgi:enoyl-CoA hydratase/carnithine racemase